MNIVFLCLGGNLGNREANLSLAIAEIKQQCGKISAQSSIYQTEAWGSSSQLKYLNQVIQIQTAYSPEQLLKTLLSIEKSFGRERISNQNADRTIDIDILFFNDEIIETNILQIPHPRLHLRNFVLQPLKSINEDFFHPKLKKTIKELALQCTDSLKVTLFKKNNIFF